MRRQWLVSPVQVTNDSPVRSRLTPVTTEERQYLPSAEDIKTEALHKELDSLELQQDEGNSGLKGVKSYLADPEENSSSSPEEIEAPAAPGAGVGGLRDILERTDRERSSSGEEWEKVSSRSVLRLFITFFVGEHGEH